MSRIALRRAAPAAGALLLALRPAAALPMVTAAIVARRAPASAPPVVGVVTDSEGQPLPDAQVIVAQLDRVATTNDQGEFRLTGLPAGTYHLTAMRIGFAATHADVTLPASGADVRIAIVMRRAAIQLSAVQVTATPTGADPRDVPQSVTTLSGQALSRALGTSVAQTLSGEPGVAVRYAGPAASAPVIRGLQGERVLVLQDGDRAGDLSSAAPDHGISIDPLTAERVEVVRGPASLLYGSQALGGVVNVISNDIPTSIPTHVDGYIATQAETVNPGAGLAAGVTVPVGQWLAIVARGGGRHSDDVRQGGGAALPNSFYRNAYGVAGLGFGTGAAVGGVVYRGYAFGYGLPSGEGERSKIDGRRHELVARADLTTGSHLVNSVRVSGSAQWYTHAEIDEPTGTTNTRFDLKTQTADALARTHVGVLSGAIGASGLFRQYAALGDEALTPAANSVGLGAFVFQELPLADTHGDPDARVPKLQVGGRVDSYRIDVRRGDPKFDRFAGTRHFGEVSGSVGVNVPIGARLSGTMSAARAFRAPSVEELASNAFHAAAGTFDVGDPSLRAEVNQGLEGSLRLQSPRLNGQLTAFYNAIAHYISPDIVKDTTVASDEGAVTVPLNHIAQADASLRGVEGRLEAQVARHVVLGTMGDLVRGEFRASKVPLPFMPASRLGALARWDDGKRSASAEYRHAFTQDRVPPAVSGGDAAGLATTAYDLVNLSVGYNLSLHGRVSSVTLRVDNLLDERYADATSRVKAFASNPGRNVALVYRVQF